MRPGNADKRVILLHLAVVAALFLLQFVLPTYHHGVFARVMVLAVFAMGYNIVFGYTGLLSLGHAMFFCAGLYGAGLTVYHLDWAVPPAFLAGLVSGLVLAVGVGVLALRTTGVAFLIVTLMFGQIFYLLTLYFAEYTRGDDGIVLSQAMRRIHLGDTVVDLTNPATRYLVAWALFSIVLFVTLALVRRPFGRVLIAIRENEERTRLLGYDTFVSKLAAMAVSGVICAAAGAAYALLVALLVYRNVSLRDLGECLWQTMRTCAMLFMIIAAAGMFGHAITLIRLPADVMEAVTALGLSQTGFILVVMIAIFILGMFLETIAIILLLAPLLSSVLPRYGIDPVHFGLLLTLNLAIGANTPPLGIDLMAACRVARIPMRETFGHLPPLLGAMASVTLALAFAPGVVLALPRMLG